VRFRTPAGWNQAHHHCRFVFIVDRSIRSLIKLDTPLLVLQVIVQKPPAANVFPLGASHERDLLYQIRKYVNGQDGYGDFMASAPCFSISAFSTVAVACDEEFCGVHAVGIVHNFIIVALLREFSAPLSSSAAVISTSSSSR
jgi:hypothetical protein